MLFFLQEDIFVVNSSIKIIPYKLGLSYCTSLLVMYLEDHFVLSRFNHNTETKILMKRNTVISLTDKCANEC